MSSWQLFNNFNLLLEALKPFCNKPLDLLRLHRILEHVEAVQETYLCTYRAPYRSWANIIKNVTWICDDICSYCLIACRTCRVYCWYTNMCPVVPQHAQGFYVSTISWKVYCRREFNAPKIAYFELYLFFRHPVFNFFKYMNF